ncbi:MAG TPA: universal stress protein [Gemmatimonadaceae bacterium]|nr:universal stress protein [Gemmatimonadaceae bacterium]
MSATETVERSEARLTPPAVGAPLITLATDGTSQSDPAIAFALALSKRRSVDVRVVTVVDHLPVPFGDIDLKLMSEIEEEMKRDALTTVTHQVSIGGDQNWRIGLESGNPAERISSVAAKTGSSMIILGLGGHGLTDRLFGSETALRLIRISRTPVLAVAPDAPVEPRRILVAMDFSEASIEAARLALEFADKKATMVLAHCVPWSPSDYVPERWFRSHEVAIAAELTRVTRWLDAHKKFRISHRILYGRVAQTLLSYAEEIGADLIVTGTHGRSVIGRILAGQTVAKLVRGARCSVLVLPAAAAFKFSDGLPETAATVGGTDWTSVLSEFSRNNAGRRARLEIDDVELGAQTEMSGYRFQGASYERDANRVTLMFGSGKASGSHLERGITEVKSIEVLSGRNSGADIALAIGHDGGQTLLVFDVPETTAARADK